MTLHKAEVRLSAIFYATYSFALLGLFGWGVLIWRQTRQAGGLFLNLVLLGLFYDNLILAIGNFTGPGPLLLALSWPRFALHQLILPWLIFSAYEQARAAGQAWTLRPLMRPAIIGLSLLVMLAGIWTRLLPLKLVPTRMDGVTRYIAQGLSGPPLVSIISVGFAGVVGALLWRKNRWPYLFLAVVFSFLAEALPVESLRRLVGSAFEVLLMFVLLLTEKRFAGGKRKMAGKIEKSARTV